MERTAALRGSQQQSHAGWVKGTGLYLHTFTFFLDIMSISITQPFHPHLSQSHHSHQLNIKVSFFPLFLKSLVHLSALNIRLL